MSVSSLVMGVLALLLSGLYFLDLAGAVTVSGVVVLVTVWTGLAAVLLARSAVRLRQRRSG